MHLIFGLLALLMTPMISQASPCSEFQWHYPSEMVEPEIFRKAREAMVGGKLSEARTLFLEFLKTNPEGVLAEGGYYVLASLPVEEDEPDKKALNAIDRLLEQRRKAPQSPYAPWALCRVGELYQEIGWTEEATGIFEEFLATYPRDSLTGGVLLNAGRSFLQTKKYIEAALIFRRLVEEPKWRHYHLEGAVGLADSTAFSHAWKQAYYWYQVVEAENPKLIRASATSAYHYGLTELQLGQKSRALEWFLITYNLHPQKVEAGHALIQIGEFLQKEHHEMPALWFFHEAALRFKNHEPGRRGEAALTRWVVSYLASPHSDEERRALYERFDSLEIYLSVSWDGVIESTRVLAQSPESELADEAQFWLARGYEETGDEKSALNAYRQLVESARHKVWKTKAEEILVGKLLYKFRNHYDGQAWVKLVQLYDAQRSLIDVLPFNGEWTVMLAEAYRHIGLFQAAMKQYNEILVHDPETKMKEDIYFWKVLLAHEQGEEQLIREAANMYSTNFPNGKWRSEIALRVGRLDVQQEDYESAVKQFSFVLEQSRDTSIRQKAHRERARAFQALGKVDSAVADYRKMIKEKTATLGTRLSLADLLYEEKRYQDAANVYQPIAESDAIAEAKTWAQFRLAMCFQETGQQKAAAELLEKVRGLGQDVKDFEATIQSAAAAVIEEFIPGKNVS